MFRKVTIMAGIVAMAMLASGCSKCGPLWDDWFQSTKSCKTDRQP